MPAGPARSPADRTPGVSARRTSLPANCDRGLEIAAGIVEKALRRLSRPASRSAGRSISWIRYPSGVSRAFKQPGVERSAQEPRILARPDTPIGVEDPVRQRDRGRQPATGPVDPAEHCAQAGGVIGRPRVGVLEVHRLVGPPGEHVVAAGGVGVVARGHAAEDAELVGNQGGARQQLGDRQAGDRRGDRSELTPDFGGGVRLGVPRRMLGGPAHQEQDDARPGPAERRARPARRRRPLRRAAAGRSGSTPPRESPGRRCASPRGGSIHRRDERQGRADGASEPFLPGIRGMKNSC